MAEVTNLHRQRHPPSAPPPAPTPAGPIEDEPLHQDEEFYHQPNIFPFDFDPFSLPNDSPIPSFFDDYATPFDFAFDLNPEPEIPGREYEIPDCIFGGEDDDEQMHFITDLFEPRPSLATETADLIWDHEFDIGPTLGSGMGLRVAAIDSDSDTELNLGFLSNIDDTFGIRTNNNHPTEFEWEEVSERIQFGEVDNLNLVINGIEEISVSSSENLISSNDEGMEEQRNLEWEVLLAVNNIESAFGFDGEVSEDHVLTMEYGALFGELAENDSALKGGPPAAKSVVDNLPLVVLTKEEIGEGDSNNRVACAVCKDVFSVMEKATKLPCSHLYHRDCIYPWLGIRNTCPVCRFELPTDDADYEKRRREGTSDGSVDDFEVSYDFELLS